MSPPPPAAAAGAGTCRAWLVDGDDATLVADEVRRLVAEVAGDDPGLTVEDFWGDETSLDAVVGACMTPPFLSDRRVVVVRDAGRFASDELAPLLAYLANPLPTTALILAGGGGKVAAKLVAAVKEVGHVIAAGPGRDAKGWVGARLRDAPLQFDAAARARLAEHLGEDLGRLPALVEVLVSAYGEGARIGTAEMEPFLGDAGAVAPWDLTDAIDRADTDAALRALHRLLEGGERHPLVVLAVLHRHVQAMLRLDGTGVATETQAAALLGIAPGRSTYPAKKAMAGARRLGADGVARAVQLLAQADVDLRGGSSWPADMVLDVLVARLSKLGPRPRTAARAR
jgi:DNA polymerase III subunit delta